MVGDDEYLLDLLLSSPIAVQLPIDCHDDEGDCKDRRSIKMIVALILLLYYSVTDVPIEAEVIQSTPHHSQREQFKDDYTTPYILHRFISAGLSRSPRTNA